MSHLQTMRLLTPGPTPIPDRVRLAMAEPMIHHRKPAFKDALAEIQTLLKALFGTEQPVLPLSCSGTGAMTAAVHGLFNAGEKVLVAEAGKFGERWKEIALVRGLETVVVSAPWGRAVEAERIREALDADPSIRGVLVQLSETSTGVTHPVREMAEITRRRNVMLVVDGISAVGISPAPMDEWGVDCLLTGSQKGLMVPPGLALLALSERAWARAEGVPPSSFYFNLPGEKANCLKNQTLFTSPVSLLLGLREALRMLSETGLPLVYRKQRALAAMARTGIRALGLELFAPDHFAWGLTSIRMPEGVSSAPVLSRAADELGVVMAAGQAPMKDSMIRLGHMGWVDWADVAAGLHALARFMPGRENAAQSPYLEQALQSYHEVMNEERAKD